MTGRHRRHGRRGAALLLHTSLFTLGALLSSSSGWSAPAHGHRTAAESAARGSADSGGDRAEPPAAELKRMGKLARSVARLRRLRRRRRLHVEAWKRARIVAHFEARLDREHSPRELAIDQAILRRLGLLPADVDYRDALRALLRDQVAGFYDHRKKRLVVASWLEIAAQRSALVHEICHALQDQHFKLRRLLRAHKHNSDRRLAAAAAVEGDCTGVMVEHMLAPTGADLSSISGALEKLLRDRNKSQTAALRKAPKFLRDTLLFPYENGLRFIQRIRVRGSWLLVNRALRRPPTTTEQILHPTKYWRRERGARIRIRSLTPLSGYQLVHHDTLGEFQLRSYIEQQLSPEAAARAAAGWDGDLLAAYAPRAESGTGADGDEPKTTAKRATASARRAERSGGAPRVSVDAKTLVLIHLSRWDSEADAMEFANGQARVLAAGRKQSDKASPRREGASVAPPKASPGSAIRSFVDTRGQLWTVERRGKVVLCLLGVPKALQPLLQTQVWQRWLINGRAVGASQR